MIVLYLLFAVIGLIIAIAVAKEFYNIAERKGYEGTKYGLYTFFCGIAGMLMVVALPPLPPEERLHPNSDAATKSAPRNPIVSTEDSLKQEVSQLSTEELMKRCQQTMEWSRAYRNICREELQKRQQSFS